MNEFYGLIIIGFLVLLYLVPTTNAITRKCRNRDAIIFINVFLGWTVIGWIVALVMALSTPAPKKAQPLPAPVVVTPPRWQEPSERIIDRNGRKPPIF